MNLNKTTKFLIAITAQLAVIFAIIIFKYSILAGGTVVLLRIQPVDPRDPFRGDYVTFQYDISQLNQGYFNYTVRNGDTVYVPLRKAGKFWSATHGISKKKPTNNSLFIKARVVSGGDGSNAKIINTRSNLVTLKYGIEEFFIPEGTGRTFNFWNKESYGKVKIDDMGNPVLEQLYVDGNEWP